MTCLVLAAISGNPLARPLVPAQHIHQLVRPLADKSSEYSTPAMDTGRQTRRGAVQQVPAGQWERRRRPVPAVVACWDTQYPNSACSSSDSSPTSSPVCITQPIKGIHHRTLPAATASVHATGLQDQRLPRHPSSALRVNSSSVGLAHMRFTSELLSKAPSKRAPLRLAHCTVYGCGGCGGCGGWVGGALPKLNSAAMASTCRQACAAGSLSDAAWHEAAWHEAAASTHTLPFHWPNVALDRMAFSNWAPCMGCTQTTRAGISGLGVPESRGHRNWHTAAGPPTGY